VLCLPAVLLRDLVAAGGVQSMSFATVVGPPRCQSWDHRQQVLHRENMFQIRRADRSWRQRPDVRYRRRADVQRGVRQRLDLKGREHMFDNRVVADPAVAELDWPIERPSSWRLVSTHDKAYRKNEEEDRRVRILFRVLWRTSCPSVCRWCSRPPTWSHASRNSRRQFSQPAIQAESRLPASVAEVKG